MLDVKDFTFFDKQSSFDFKGFLIKTLSYWKWFTVGLIIAFSIAHQVNIRKQKFTALKLSLLFRTKTIRFLLQIQVWYLIGVALRIKFK